MNKFLVFRWLLVGLLASGAISLIANPAHAQTDQRFFGVWQPASTTAGGNPLTVEPGRITTWNKDKFIWDQRYEVIRDFGARVVVRIWTVKASFDYPLNESSLAVLSVKQSLYRGSGYLTLAYDYCGSKRAFEYFFRTMDKDEIWQRILSWSARRRDRGFPYDHCVLNEDGSEGEEWSGMGFERAARPGE